MREVKARATRHRPICKLVAKFSTESTSPWEILSSPKNARLPNSKMPRHLLEGNRRSCRDKRSSNGARDLLRRTPINSKAEFWSDGGENASRSIEQDRPTAPRIRPRNPGETCYSRSCSSRLSFVTIRVETGCSSTDIIDPPRMSSFI